MSFIRSDRGNFAIIFALALLPIMLAIGMAVDYSQLSNLRSKVQNVADASALAGAREVDKTSDERKAIAKDYFLSQISTIPENAVAVSLVADDLTVQIDYEHPTSFMGLLGVQNMAINVESIANIGVRGVEVALVLDVSGSMNAMFPDGTSRISQLKTSSKSLISKIEGSVGSKGKISIVPFTMNVNVGKANTDFVTGNTNPLFAGTEWMGCVQERAAPNHIANDPGAKLQAYIWPPTPDGGMCKNSSNGTNTGYANMNEAAGAGLTSAQFDGPNRNCVRHEIMPLSNNYPDLISKIDSLDSQGNDGTIIAPGITWGLRTLSREWPFTEGDQWNSGTGKVLVVLTDGSQTTEVEYQNSQCQNASNTVTPFSFDPKDFGMGGKKLTVNGPHDNWTPYGFYMDSDPFSEGLSSESDLPNSLSNLSLAACTEAKKSYSGNAIEIFTIGVSDQTAPGTEIYNVLHNCASKPENHFFVENAAGLEAAFDAITGKVTELRLRK